MEAVDDMVGVPLVVGRACEILDPDDTQGVALEDTVVVAAVERD